MVPLASIFSTQSAQSQAWNLPVYTVSTAPFGHRSRTGWLQLSEPVPVVASQRAPLGGLVGQRATGNSYLHRPRWVTPPRQDITDSRRCQLTYLSCVVARTEYSW